MLVRLAEASLRTFIIWPTSSSTWVELKIWLLMSRRIFMSKLVFPFKYYVQNSWLSQFPPRLPGDVPEKCWPVFRDARQACCGGHRLWRGVPGLQGVQGHSYHCRLFSLWWTFSSFWYCRGWLLSTLTATAVPWWGWRRTEPLTTPVHLSWPCRLTSKWQELV